MINVYYCTDNKLFSQQVISLLSLAQTCSDALNVVNLTVEIPEYAPKGLRTSVEQDELCNKILKRYNPESTFRSIDVSDLMRKYLWGGPNMHNKYYSYYVVVRLLADLVEEIPDKVLYLDADTIMCKDIKPFYDMNVDKYELVGRRDLFFPYKYIQSGVMLLNMKLIRERGSFAKARHLCLTKKYVCYIDMSAINSACKSKKLVRRIYNHYQYSDKAVIHHVCATRESNFPPFTKKWWHRIKIDEIDLMKKRHPVYIPLYEQFEQIREAYPHLF
ncbi:MAG: hypothetical protein NC132_05445 [Corallococcus sp.]|nr:hypothetical protein [Corallococcus sp.]MCM1359981.1 hypothetical protein [Corallococcus sp.]MCM1395538.1 hypothetical protein [Corallococcus sp.]